MTDPIKELPTELIVPAFSSLSTPQLCLMNGVSHDWRAALESETILYRVIDLLNVKRPLSEKEMIEIVRRLCHLSTHPRNELLLDITNFWYSFSILASKHNIGSEHVMFSSPNEFHSLLSAIAIETKGKLDKLVLLVDCSHFPRRSTTNEDAFATAIVQGWDELVAMNEGVRELHLQVPSSSISVQSRAPGEGGRVCSIESDLSPSRPKGSWQVSECKVFLEKVVAFTGASITHLGFCTNSFDSVEKLYQMMHLHKDSLTHLELEVEISDRPQLSLQVAVQCQNLSSLRLCYYLVEHIEWDPTAWPMVFPSDAAISHLKEFEFCTDGDYLDLSSYPFLNWLGKDSESFKLSGITTRKVQLQSLKFIFSSNPALKVIKLDSLKIFRASDSFVSSPLRFTNLHSLELHSVSGYGLTMFSTSLKACPSQNAKENQRIETLMNNCVLSFETVTYHSSR